MWRWARLKEGKIVNYIHLPHSFTAETETGRHITAYRQAVFRHLGYDPDNQKVSRILTRKTTAHEVATLSKSERLALIHFHPDMHPYILEEMESQGKRKVNKYRIPMEVGRRLGLAGDDKCPTNDTNGVPSFFALPNYTLEEAAADLDRAEEAYKAKYRNLQAENEQLYADMTRDPSKYVMELHDLKQQNAYLQNVNNELNDRLKRENIAKAAIEKKTVRLQKGLEKMARRLDKWESTKKIGRTPNCNAKDIYKDATGQDLSEEGYFGVEPCGNNVKYPKGRGGKRWSDPRMDRAVEARWQDPTLSTEEALRIGGYEFPDLEGSGKLQKDTVDSDNVSVTQRKNNLLRRLRQKKNAEDRKAAGGSGGAKGSGKKGEKSKEEHEVEGSGETMMKGGDKDDGNEVAEEALGEASIEDLV